MNAISFTRHLFCLCLLGAISAYAEDRPKTPGVTILEVPERRITPELNLARADIIRHMSLLELEEAIGTARPGAVVSVAWEISRRRELQHRQHSETPHRAAYFIGFLEGRNGITVPYNFSQSLQRSFQKGQNAQSDPTPGQEPKRTGKVLIEGERMTLSFGADATIIKNKPYGVSGDGIVFRHGSYWYLACRDLRFPEPFQLFCFHDGSRELLWQKRVEASGILNYSGGGHYHLVDITCSRSHVHVFGVFAGGYYIESYNARNGAIVCKFLTKCSEQSGN